MFYKDEKTQKCIKCIIENKVFECYFSDDYVDDDTDEYPFGNGGEE